MKCSDVRALLPGLALGDLDAEPAREAAEHLRACAECRAAEAGVASTVAALGAAEAVGPSAERRDAAVAAMARAQAEQAERLLVRRPRKGTGWIAAAAAVLAAVTVFLWAAPGPEFTVAEVAGRADVYRARTGRFAPLAAGEEIRPGDRLVTGSGAVVRLAGPGGSLWINQETAVAFGPSRRVVLDRGEVFAELASPSPALEVIDWKNNLVSVRQGRLEAGLREVRRLVAGTQEPKAGAADPPPAPRVEVSHELVTRMAEGEAGTFTLGGQASMTKVAAAEVAPWRAPGYYRPKK
jgi:hypothetical protein